MKQLKIRDFTEPELQHFRDVCNFTDEEREYFELKAKDKTIVQIAQSMYVSESKVSSLARKVRRKIKKVI